MDSPVISLIEKERVGVLSVPLEDGSPHVAVVHYSEQIDPVKIFIHTYPTVKTAAIKTKAGVTKAAMVIGLSEEKFITLQMRGIVRIVSDMAERDKIFAIHYAKHPEAEKYKSPSTILLEFEPDWWRYTDFNTEPETVIGGE